MNDSPEKIISDEEIIKVHGYANFGSMTPREVVNEGVRNYAIGYTGGSTQVAILREHGLITAPKGNAYKADLTEKGKRYARSICKHVARLAALKAQHAKWSQAQFGDVSAIGPAKHLAKEALEVAANPTDVMEHADCWMLLWDMQRRAGISDQQLAEAIAQKMEIVKARNWPAPIEGEACEHDRAPHSLTRGE